MKVFESVATVEPMPKNDRRPVDPHDLARGTVDASGKHFPAPPIIREGEPPLADNWYQEGEPAELLPGEPGYVPPTQGD
jgi:hypothetical protein